MRSEREERENVLYCCLVVWECDSFWICIYWRCLDVIKQRTENIVNIKHDMSVFVTEREASWKLHYGDAQTLYIVNTYGMPSSPSATTSNCPHSTGSDGTWVECTTWSQVSEPGYCLICFLSTTKLTSHKWVCMFYYIYAVCLFWVLELGQCRACLAVLWLWFLKNRSPISILYPRK